MRTVTGVAAALLVLVTLENRAAAHCHGGSGIYRACCEYADAQCDASNDKFTDTVARQVAQSSHQYKYSNQHGRSKPAIKRMGQINVRNRNGGIR